MALLIDSEGYVIGSYDGPGLPANGVRNVPPENAIVPLRYVNGSWLVPSTKITYTAFLTRFTGDERSMIRALQQRDANVADFIMLAQAASFIDLQDQRVQQGLAYFVSIKAITSARAEEIISAPVVSSEMP